MGIAPNVWFSAKSSLEFESHKVSHEFESCDGYPIPVQSSHEFESHFGHPIGIHKGTPDPSNVDLSPHAKMRGYTALGTVFLPVLALITSLIVIPRLPRIIT